nr:MEKHLA domain-containing protein [Nitrospirota bacterium]
MLNYGNRIALDLWEMDWEAFSRWTFLNSPKNVGST